MTLADRKRVQEFKARFPYEEIVERTPRSPVLILFAVLSYNIWRLIDFMLKADINGEMHYAPVFTRMSVLSPLPQR